jgi:hypothetical protein
LELIKTGESSTELAAVAVNGLIIFAAETTARNYKTDSDPDWTEKVNGARKIAEEIIPFAALEERMPAIDFLNEFDRQEERAREYPDEVIDISPEQKESGLRGLAWYAREMLVTAGLDCESQVIAVQSMMAAFAAQWKSLQPMFERLNGSIQAEINALRSETQTIAAEQDADDGNFAEARQRLLDRAQQNWNEFRNTPLVTTSENIYHKAAAVVGYRDANIFIKDYADFTAEDVDRLLLFANPVDLVAGYLDPKSDVEDMTGILASIRDDLENLKQHYTLAPDPAAPGLEELEQRLRDRIEENYSVYKRDMLDSGKEEIFKSASEIAAVSEIYEYVTQEHSFKESEVDFLLKFQNPLEVLSDGRNAGLYDVKDTVDWVMDDQERTLNQRGYELMPDEADSLPDAPEQPPRMTVANGEKPSVMERIRQAANEPKTPRKDALGHKKTGPEL